MARYTCSYLAQVPVEKLQPSLSEFLQACGFNTVYQISDYMMAQEIRGKVGFSKLVTVEVLIDTTTATDEEVMVNLVVKNDELPLQTTNHCRQMFDLIQKTIAEDRHWQLIESMS